MGVPVRWKAAGAGGGHLQSDGGGGAREPGTPRSLPQPVAQSPPQLQLALRPTRGSRGAVVNRKGEAEAPVCTDCAEEAWDAPSRDGESGGSRPGHILRPRRSPESAALSPQRSRGRSTAPSGRAGGRGEWRGRLGSRTAAHVGPQRLVCRGCLRARGRRVPPLPLSADDVAVLTATPRAPRDCRASWVSRPPACSRLGSACAARVRHAMVSCCPTFPGSPGTHGTRCSRGRRHQGGAGSSGRHARGPPLCMLWSGPCAAARSDGARRFGGDLSGPRVPQVGRDARRSNYRVYRDGALAAEVPSTGFEDTEATSAGAPAAPGATSATAGTLHDRVRIQWTAAVNPRRPVHKYTVSAVNTVGEGPRSAPAAGFRGPAPVRHEVSLAPDGEWLDVGDALHHDDLEAARSGAGGGRRGLTGNRAHVREAAGCQSQGNPGQPSHLEESGPEARRGRPKRSR